MPEWVVPVVAFATTLLVQLVVLVWKIRGQVDQGATKQELAQLRHRVNNMAVIVEHLANERPSLRTRVEQMVKP